MEDFCRPCYVSILPSLPPSTTASQQYSLHFKFDLMPPFPSFIPSLSLQIPSKSCIFLFTCHTTCSIHTDCVILNTGDSIIALRYSLPPTPSDTSPPHFPSVYSTHLLQRFASASLKQGAEDQRLNSSFAQSLAGTSGSPSHLLPVDVYLGNQLMEDVSFQSEMVVV